MADEKQESGINIDDLERKLSVVAGGSFLYFALKKGNLFSLISAFLGATFVYRGVTGHSRIYEAIRKMEIGRQDDVAVETEKTSGSTEETEGVGNGLPKKERKRTEKSPNLASLSKDELYQQAQAKEIPGRSKMNKAQLIKALKGS